MIQKHDVCVLIAAYNEEKKLPHLLHALRQDGWAVYVVDDGSHDSTPHILRSLQIPHEVNPVNRGKGAALRQGFTWFLSQSYKACVIMDADGQHRVEELHHFVAALNTSDSHLVLGNRMHKTAGMSWIRVWTNHFMSWVLSTVARQKMPDTQCGYRALTRTAVEKVQFKTDRFEAESEMLLRASRAGLKIVSTPVTSIYGDEKSRIHPVRDTVRFFTFLFRYLFHRY